MMQSLERLAAEYGAEFAAHVGVSSIILVAALAVARWAGPMTARTRNAVLLAGLGSLLVPPALFGQLAELVAGRVVSLPVALPPMIRGVVAPIAAPPAETVSWRAVVVAVWLGVSTLLFLRWWLTSRRLVVSAMRLASMPDARIVAALDAARGRLSLRHGVDAVVSPLAEAPAVLRVVRPLLVVPSGLSETLDDDELESLLCHECAHVARRDNLAGVLEAVVCSLFWFNPLVWMVHGRIGITREVACDERVAESAIGPGTYAAALAKFCRSLVAPRVAGVSCMASTHMKERMEHLMNYEALRKHALPHGAVSAVTIALVTLFVAGAGFVTAQPPAEEKRASGPFVLSYSVERINLKQILFQFEVADATTKEVLAAPSVTTTLGQLATVRTGVSGTPDAHEVVIAADPRPDGSGTIVMVVQKDGREIQKVSYEFGPQLVEASTPGYTGQPISLNLKDADIRDVLKTFADLTGTNIAIDPEVKGTVTVDFKDVPWDQALDIILRQNGLTYQTVREGGLRVRPAN